MKDYTYHDTEHAEFVLKNGFLSKYLYNDMRVIALYYRDIMGYKPKKREEELYAFCEKNIENYNKVLYFKIIDRALSFASKKNNKLIDIDSIPIYQKEIDYIDSLPIDYNEKKIIFTILVRIKINKKINNIINSEDYYGYFTSKNLNDKKIIKYSNILNSKKIIDYFYKLEKMNYITTYYTGAMRINILYDMPEVDVENDKIIVEIKDFNNIGYYFDYYFNNGRIKFCKKCDMPFKATGRNSKYCKEHQGYQKVSFTKTKNVLCIDCGKEFVVDARNNNKNRCEECYKIYRKNQIKNAVKKNRENKKNK